MALTNGRLSKKDARHPASLSLENKAILVVEDNRLNQLIVQKNLEKTACKLHFVENGFKALEALRLYKFDLILMDCQMPELDGYQTTQIIRKSKDEKTSRIPIIAVTANIGSLAQEKCRSVGMNAFVSKPFDRELLLQEICRLIK